MLVATAAEMRRLDQLTIERYGIPGITLMERAGTGATEMLLEQFPYVRKRRVVVVCGKGNNGGDGLVIARLLKQKKVAVETFLLGAASDVRGDAKLALAAFLRTGKLRELRASSSMAPLAKALEGAALIVDAIFGTGLSAPVTGYIAEIIHLLNASGVPIFAVDTPSGLDSDRGIPSGATIQAEATATFGFAKLGQVLYPGIQYVGALGVADIGLAAGAIDEARPAQRLLTAEEVASWIPRRVPDAHKGTSGHVAIFAGSLGHTGAAQMCAHAACRIGAGLTTLAGPRSLNSIFATARPEVMTAPLADRAGLVRYQAAAVKALYAGKSALAVGPGLGTHADGIKLTRQLVRAGSIPLVVDADGLTNLVGKLDLLARRALPAVLTPHPGEMARLMNTNTAAVQQDRVGIARRCAVENRCVVVLKGARTLVALPDGEVWINPTGNPGMASGGMGDALTGMIAGLLAQGLAPAAAAGLGVYLHGECADFLAATRGPIGFLASDVIEAIPGGLQRLRLVAETSAHHG